MNENTYLTFRVLLLLLFNPTLRSGVNGLTFAVILLLFTLERGSVFACRTPSKPRRNRESFRFSTLPSGLSEQLDFCSRLLGVCGVSKSLNPPIAGGEKGDVFVSLYSILAGDPSSSMELNREFLGGLENPESQKSSALVVLFNVVLKKDSSPELSQSSIDTSLVSCSGRSSTNSSGLLRSLVNAILQTFCFQKL